MKTLKIEVPKGHEVESFDTETGVIKFRETPKDVTERIKTLEDAINELGESDPEVRNYRALQNITVSAHLINNQKLVIITKALNEGWIPNWDDSDEWKHAPWFEMGSSGFRYYDYDYWATDSGVGSRLCFKTEELGEYAGKQFPEIYKIAYTQ